MRVNIDSQALSEPRIRFMARALGEHPLFVLGRLIPVWMQCYERKSPLIRSKEVDLLADREGFAAAMVAEELADDTTTVENAAEIALTEGYVYVRGVSERIEFLEKQAARGRLSGEARRKPLQSKRKNAFQTTLDQVLNGRSTECSTECSTNGSTVGSAPGSTGSPLPVNNSNRTTRSTNGSTSGSTYSLSPDLDLAPDLAPDHPPEFGQTASSYPQGSQNAISASPVVGDADQVKMQPRASQEPYVASQDDEPQERKGKRRIPEPPDEALIAAHLLLGYVTKNHPTSVVAKAPDKKREERALSWANDIRLMNERDRLAYPHIESMINWASRHEFWSTVILSAENLRAKWDMMVAQRSRAKGNANPVPQQSKMRQLHDYVTEANARDEAAEKEPIV